MSMFIGEALVGGGNEVAHIDLLIGSKDGPVGTAFANALANQSQGHSNLLAVLEPNLICKPVTVLITKVSIKGAGQAVQMFGPAQAAVGKAVADSVAAGVISKAQAEDLVIVCGVFIHPEASDNAKILKYNYDATKTSIQRAMKSLPTPQEIAAQHVEPFDLRPRDGICQDVVLDLLDFLVDRFQDWGIIVYDEVEDGVEDIIFSSRKRAGTALATFAHRRI